MVAFEERRPYLFNSMKNERIVFVDYIRVIACFLVMLVHASENFYGADPSGMAGNMSVLLNESTAFGWLSMMGAWDVSVSRCSWWYPLSCWFP